MQDTQEALVPREPHFSLAIVCPSLPPRYCFRSVQQYSSVQKTCRPPLRGWGNEHQVIALGLLSCSDGFTHPRLTAALYAPQPMPKPEIDFRPQQLGPCSCFTKLQVFSPRSLTPLGPVHSGYPQGQAWPCTLHLATCLGTPIKSERLYLPGATCKCNKPPDLVLSRYQTLKAWRLCNVCAKPGRCRKGKGNN